MQPALSIEKTRIGADLLPMFPQDGKGLLECFPKVFVRFKFIQNVLFNPLANIISFMAVYCSARPDIIVSRYRNGPMSVIKINGALYPRITICAVAMIYNHILIFYGLQLLRRRIQHRNYPLVLQRCRVEQIVCVIVAVFYVKDDALNHYRGNGFELKTRQNAKSITVIFLCFV